MSTKIRKDQIRIEEFIQAVAGVNWGSDTLTASAAAIAAKIQAEVGTCNMPPAASFVARLITSAVEVGKPTGMALAMSVGEYPLGTAVASHNFYTVKSSDLGGTDFYVYVSPMPTPNVRQRCVFLNIGRVDIHIYICNSDSSLHTLITEYRNGYTLRGGDAVEFNFITVDNAVIEEAKENVYGAGKEFDMSLVNGVITTCTIESNDFGIVNK